MFGVSTWPHSEFKVGNFQPPSRESLSHDVNFYFFSASMNVILLVAIINVGAMTGLMIQLALWFLFSVRQGV